MTRTCFSPVWIGLTQGKCMMLDEPDAPLLMRHKWYAIRRGRLWHAMRTQKRAGVRQTFYAHRVLTDAPRGTEVDHANHDGLDNRRQNLRVCSHQENIRNQGPRNQYKTSVFRGVSWSIKRGKWIAALCIDRRQTNLGGYTSEAEAARAYDRAALIHYGAFASTNFPREEYPDATI